jgi:(1->4)-alpha-D-glucan 1-alpha-D-glucosylmutase
MADSPPLVSSPPLVATYRLQLTPTFGLREATDTIPYLARLGISHVYTSSYLQAAAGSNHGYDTVDHSRVSDELGGEDALVAFHAALRANGMGNVVDVVPNHMSVSDATANRRWWNVLRDGPQSADAGFFDIDWDPPQHKLAGKVLLAVLGNDYAAELEAGAITIVTRPTVAVGGIDAFEVRYGDLRFPVTANAVDPSTHRTAPSTPAAIHQVLEQQHYRLACWRVGRDELNYRRFFDVTTLAGVRVEDPEVFAAVHERTLQWVRSGDVQGLRIDHPDGLRDPTGYFRQLREAAPDAWIVVEKILEPGERLPQEWPVDGTTGYDRMRTITAVFVDQRAERVLSTVFDSLDSAQRPYEEQLVECKQLVIGDLFGAEVTRLVDLAAGACEASVRARDFSRREIHVAVVALLVATPVYRTYVTPNAEPPVTAQDEAIIVQTLATARQIEPLIDARLFDFLGDLLRTVAGEFVARFQQLSGPAMAKGLEDTLFYRYNRLVALNEVGSDPASFGMSIEEFHTEMLDAAQRSPRSMSATSTHDTKRSEDVRARIAMLSEVPDEWRETVERWIEANQSKWGEAKRDTAMEYLLYQTMFGASPLSAERARQFLQKAVREAKQSSTWLHPTDFEGDLFAFADALASDPEFQLDLAAFVDRFQNAGRIASLSQLLLKATVPGIPDFYQGSELWTTTLVDPDNRHDVDYAERIELLNGLDDGQCSVLSLKLWFTRRLLQLRRAIPEAFTGADATYEPLALKGPRATSAVAFTRGRRVIVVAPVRPVAIDRNGWADTRIMLPGGEWIDALDGPTIGAGRRFAECVSIRDAAHHDCVVLISTGAPA